MLQATNFTQSIPAKVTVEYCRLDQGGAPGVDGGDVLHDGLHLVRHLQVLQVNLLCTDGRNIFYLIFLERTRDLSKKWKIQTKSADNFLHSPILYLSILMKRILLKF